MPGQRVLLTYQDYAELPDDGRQYELHEGELSVTPAPGTGHQRASGRLFRIVAEHVERHALGEVFYAPFDCILSDTTVVQPDLVFLDTSSLSRLSERGLEGPPTLAVEIISPYSARIDRVRKLQLYAQFGVPYYWIVAPDARTVEAYTLVDKAYEPSGSVILSTPGSLPPFADLVLDPAAIWR